MTDISIEGFDIKNNLGTGSSCKVYRATNTQTGKDVAVKVMNSLSEEADCFEAEVHALKTIKKH